MSDIVPISREGEFEPIVDLKELSPEERKKAEEVAKSVDLQDPTAVTQFGVGHRKT